MPRTAAPHGYRVPSFPRLCANHVARGSPDGQGMLNRLAECNDEEARC